MTYEIIIKKNKQNYTFCIKELNLIHVSENLDKGYEEINKKKDEILKSFAENEINLPTVKQNSEILLNNKMGKFIFKSLIISASVTFVISFSLITFFKNFNESASNFKIKTGREFWGQLEKNIIDLSKPENQIKPQTHEKAIKSIKILVERYKPYIKEASKVFDD